MRKKWSMDTSLVNRTHLPMTWYWNVHMPRQIQCLHERISSNVWSFIYCLRPSVLMLAYMCTVRLAIHFNSICCETYLETVLHLYLPKYTMMNFFQFIIWKVEDHLIIAHKVKHVLYRYFPDNLWLWQGIILCERFK
jgi:hypothetical protein